MMNKDYKELLEELKKLQEVLINIGFIAENMKDLDIEDMECYPFDTDIANVTADVADWIDEIREITEE